MNLHQSPLIPPQLSSSPRDRSSSLVGDHRRHAVGGVVLEMPSPVGVLAMFSLSLNEVIWGDILSVSEWIFHDFSTSFSVYESQSYTVLQLKITPVMAVMAVIPAPHPIQVVALREVHDSSLVWLAEGGSHEKWPI